LDQSRTCAVFVGPTGLGPWQNEEMRSALEDRVRNKAFRVIPVLLPGALQPSGEKLPRFLRRLTWVDFRTGLDDEETFRRLLHGIKGMPPGPGGGEGPSLISYRCMAQPPDGFIHRSEYEKVLEALCPKDGTGQASPSVGITTALRGAGGFGKTALAQALCFDERIRRQYPDGILWTTLGENLDPESRLSRILDLIRSWSRTESPGFKGLEAAGVYLRELLSDRRVLVVVDDVWSPADISPFQGIGNGSAILITTRNRQTLPGNSVRIEVDAMASQEAVSLLRSELPRGEESDFQGLAAQLGEWPLLLKLVNRQLRGLVKEDGFAIPDALKETKSVLESEGFSAFDQDDPESRHAAASRTILVSVRRLAEKERGMYFQLAVFPEDADIPLAILEGYWGLNHFAARKFCGRLYDLSLLHDFDVKNGTIRLHDVIRKFLIEQVGDGVSSLHTRLLASHRPASGRWADLVEEDQYLWRNLAGHFLGADRIDELRDLLVDFSFLEAKLKATDVNVVISDYAALTGKDQEYRLIQDALRLSAHVLGRDKRQLAPQLLGRLLNRKEEHIQKLLSGASSWQGEFWLRPKTASLTQPGGALIRTLIGHEYGVTAVAVVDSNRVISGAEEGTLRLWNLTNGEVICTLLGHLSGVRVLAAIDNHRILSGSDDGPLRLWDLGSSTTIRTYGRSTGQVRALAVVNDCSFISGTEEGLLWLWDLSSGEAIRVLEGHRGWVCAVAIVNGFRAISGSSDGTLRLWDLANGATLRVFEGHDSWVNSISVIDEQHVISGSDDATLRVWDLNSGETLKILRGHTARVSAVAVVDSRCAISGSEDQTLRAWDLDTGECLRVLEGHSRRVSALARVDACRVVSGSLDETLRLWSLDRSDSRRPAQHAGWVRSVVAVDAERAVSGSDDGTLRVWQLGNEEICRTLRGHTGEVRSVTMSDSRHVISASLDMTIRLWDLYSGETLRTLRGHTAGVSAVARRDSGTVLTGSFDLTIREWDLAKGVTIQRLEGHTKAVTAVALVDADRAVSGSDDRTLRIWDLNRGRALHILEGHTAHVSSVVVLDEHRAVSGSFDGTLRVWDLDNGKLLRTLEGHSGWIMALAAVEGSRIISGGDDATLRIWDLESEETLGILTTEFPIHAVAVTPDGRTVVAGDRSGNVHFFDLVVPE
jgi:WD40 repeat protein